MRPVSLTVVPKASTFMSGRYVNDNRRDADEVRDHNLARARHTARVEELMGPRPTEIMAGIMYDLDYTALMSQTPTRSSLCALDAKSIAAQRSDLHLSRN